MIPKRTGGAFRPRWFAVLLGLALAVPVGAQEPHVGDVQRLKVITIALQVSSTQKETRQVTYTPPPGWYVRSHVVQCTQKTGNSSFSVTTVPRNWDWVSEETARESFQLLIDLAGKVRDAGLQARFRQERDQTLRELRRSRSSHHALVLEATARGEGFLRGGGSLQLTVTAELVYVGTDTALRQTVARHRARMK